MIRAQERLAVVGPLTLAIIMLLLYLSFRRFTEVLIIMGTLPMALIGGFWLLYLLGYDLSVAVGVGFIALAGVAVEIGVVLLVYLNLAIGRRAETARRENRPLVRADIEQAVIDGALMRVRPIMMTVAAIVARPFADHARRRHGVGSHAAHRGADGWRNAQRDAPHAGRNSCALPGLEGEYRGKSLTFP